MRKRFAIPEESIIPDYTIEKITYSTEEYDVTITYFEGSQSLTYTLKCVDSIS